MSDHREGCRWHGHPLRHQIRPTTACCKEPAHLHECWAKHPSDPEAWCICDELRACEKRVTAHERSWENAVIIARAGYQDGYDAAIAAAKRTIAAIPAEYKTRGDYDSYGPYAEGKADFKDLALSAIDALRKEEQ